MNSKLEIKNKSILDRYDYIYSAVLEFIGDTISLEKANILDFGCGAGISALRFAHEYPQSLAYGCDISMAMKKIEAIAKNDIGFEALPSNLNLKQVEHGVFPFPDTKFDLIFSWSVFEHVNIKLMDGIIQNLKNLLKPDGVMLIQINPLYYSSRGSHLYNFIAEPWCHLTHQHDNLRELVLQNPLGSKANQDFYWSEYESLNKITASELVEIFQRNGLALIKEERKVEKLVPPARLLRIFREDVLNTHSIKLLLKST